MRDSFPSERKNSYIKDTKMSKNPLTKTWYRALLAQFIHIYDNYLLISAGFLRNQFNTE